MTILDPDGSLAWQGIAAEKPASKLHSLLIGAAEAVVNGEIFTGSIDEVSVWTRALSAAEITWLAGS